MYVLWLRELGPSKRALPPPPKKSAGQQAIDDANHTQSFKDWLEEKTERTEQNAAKWPQEDDLIKNVCAVTGQPTPTPTIVRADPSRALTADNLAVVCKSRMRALSAAGWSISRLLNPPIRKKRRRR